MFILMAPCLFEHPSLIRLSTSRSRLVNGFCPAVLEAHIHAGLRSPSPRRPAGPSVPDLQSGSDAG